MMQHHGYSLTELDGMLPWERELYVMFLQKWLEEERLRMESNRQGT